MFGILKHRIPVTADRLNSFKFTAGDAAPGDSGDDYGDDAFEEDG